MSHSVRPARIAVCTGTLCVAVTALCLRSGTGETSSARTGPVVRAMARQFHDMARVVPPPPLKLSGGLSFEAEGALVQKLGSEPDENKWVTNLEQVMAVLENEQSDRGIYLWGMWNGGILQISPESLLRRLASIPSEKLEALIKIRLSNGHRAFPDMVRLWPAPQEMTGLPDQLALLLKSTTLGERISEGGQDLKSVMERGLFYELLAGTGQDLKSAVERDVLDRLANQPDKLVDFALHHNTTLTAEDRELRGTGRLAGFFYGPERRIDAILAAPPSMGRDLLLEAAVWASETPPEDFAKLAAAITNKDLRRLTQINSSARTEYWPASPGEETLSPP